MSGARRALTMNGVSAFVPSALPISRLRARPRFSSSSSRPAVSAVASPPRPSLTQLASDVRSRTVSATTLTEKSLARVAQIEPTVHSFLHVDAELALARAAAVDRRLAAGEDPGPLAGVPVAVKDNICTAGQQTTAASALLDGFVPAYSATAVSRLEAAGAVVLGKTNMDEFGMGSSTETSAYQNTRNPWDLSCVPGGSSGGSAAAVAAGEVSFALGSDTGGSIRQPAAYCGVTGIRPSYGRVSRHGLLAYASSLDTVGPICGSVADAALVLQTIAGRDHMDSTSVDAPVPGYAGHLMNQPDLNGYTIGVVEDALGDGVDSDVVKCVREAVETLRGLGAKVKSVSLPKLTNITAAYYVIAVSEASANLARYDGVRYGVRDTGAQNSSDMYARSRANGFGHEVKKRIMAGTYALSSGYYDAYYVRAQRVRTMVATSFEDMFKQGVDVLVSPVAPSPAFKIGAMVDDPIAMLLEDIMTIPASLAGLPALSVPCGFSSSRLPVGMQLMGPFLGEESVLQVGHAFQLATDYHLQTSDVLEDSLSSVVLEDSLSSVAKV